MKEIGIYVHIPFCKRKCYYCDFCSFEGNTEIYRKYINALIKEIQNYKVPSKDESIEEKVIVKTVYFGGGTPSIINENLIENVINTLKNKFNIDKNAEITIEINPGTASINKIKKYKDIGFNRVSIGLQSTNDRLLSLIGRIHNYNEFESVYNMARLVGFSNINVDLMIGLPTQTMDDIDDSLKKIIKKNPEHISVYSLIVEEYTKLKELIDDHKLELPDENLERDMYWKVKKILEENGYHQYEISNFSKTNYYSRHNTDCWNQKEYLGFGLSAHSYYNKKRFSNLCNLNEYVENIVQENYEKNKIIQEIQDDNSRMNEYVILKLRMTEGVKLKEFYDKFNMDFLKTYEQEVKRLEKQGLINIDENSVMLSNKGIDFANIVWSEFI